MSGLEILRDEDLRQNLVKLHCPIGMIFGENDILIKRAAGIAIQALRPDVHTIEIPATGHAPFLSRPRETADALIKLTARLC
jgi:pimeloyl-[acyl-carrier protein] methyl ester esterase